MRAKVVHRTRCKDEDDTVSRVTTNCRQRQAPSNRAQLQHPSPARPHNQLYCSTPPTPPHSPPPPYPLSQAPVDSHPRLISYTYTHIYALSSPLPAAIQTPHLPASNMDMDTLKDQWALAENQDGVRLRFVHCVQIQLGNRSRGAPVEWARVGMC